MRSPTPSPDGRRARWSSRSCECAPHMPSCRSLTDVAVAERASDFAGSPSALARSVRSRAWALGLNILPLHVRDRRVAWVGRIAHRPRTRHTVRRSGGADELMPTAQVVLLEAESDGSAQVYPQAWTASSPAIPGTRPFAKPKSNLSSSTLKRSGDGLTCRPVSRTHGASSLLGIDDRSKRARCEYRSKRHRLT